MICLAEIITKINQKDPAGASMSVDVSHQVDRHAIECKLRAFSSLTGSVVIDQGVRQNWIESVPADAFLDYSLRKMHAFDVSELSAFHKIKADKSLSDVSAF